MRVRLSSITATCLIAVALASAVSCINPFQPSARGNNGVVVPFPVFDPRNPAQALDIGETFQGLWRQVDQSDSSVERISTWYFSRNLVRVRDTLISGNPRSIIVYKRESGFDRAIDATGGQGSTPGYRGYEFARIAADLLVVREYDGQSGTPLRRYILVKETAPVFSAEAFVYTPDSTSAGIPAAAAQVALRNLDDDTDVLSTQSDGAGNLHFSGLKPGVFYRAFVDGQASIVLRAHMDGSFLGRIPVPEPGGALMQPEFPASEAVLLAGGMSALFPVSLRNIGQKQAAVQDVVLSVSASTGTAGIVGQAAFTTAGALLPSSADGANDAMSNMTTPTVYQEIIATASAVDASAIAVSNGIAWVRVRVEIANSPIASATKIYSYSVDIPVYAQDLFESYVGAHSAANNSAGDLRFAAVLPGHGVFRQNGATVNAPTKLPGSWILVSNSALGTRSYYQIGRQLGVTELIESPGSLFQNVPGLVPFLGTDVSRTLYAGDIVTSYVDAQSCARYNLPLPANPSATPPPVPNDLYASNNTRPNVKLIWSAPASPAGDGIEKYRLWSSYDSGLHFAMVAETTGLTVIDPAAPTSAETSAGAVNRLYKIESYDPDRGWSGFGAQATISGGYRPAQPYYVNWSFDSTMDIPSPGPTMTPGQVAVQSGRIYVSAVNDDELYEIRQDGSILPFNMQYPTPAPSPTASPHYTIDSLEVGPGGTVWTNANDYNATGVYYSVISAYDPTSKNLLSNHIPGGSSLPFVYSAKLSNAGPNRMAIINYNSPSLTPSPPPDIWSFTPNASGTVSGGVDMGVVDTSGVTAPAVGFVGQNPVFVSASRNSGAFVVADRSLGFHLFAPSLLPVGFFKDATVDPAVTPINAFAIDYLDNVYVMYDGVFAIYRYTPIATGSASPTGVLDLLSVFNATLGRTEGRSSAWTVPAISSPEFPNDLYLDEAGNIWIIPRLGGRYPLLKLVPRTSF